MSVALVNQQETRMRSIIQFLAWLCHIFSHYLTNGTNFEKKVSEYKMCVLIFSTHFVRNVSQEEFSELLL